MADEVTIKIIRKISELSRDQWDALTDRTTPFAKWDWLDSLEQSGCVSEESGWLPHHVVAEQSGKLVAAAVMAWRTMSG